MSAVKHKISVIIAAKDLHDPRLLLAYQSIKNQTLPSEEYQIIIVADPPVEGSILPVDAIATNEGKGYIGARNTGLKWAIGEWTVFADSDDFFLPNRLKALLEMGEKNQAKIVYHNYLVGDADLNVLFSPQTGQIGITSFPNLLNIQTMLINTAISDFSLVHKSVWKEFGYLKEKYDTYAMEEMWLRVVEKYPRQCVLQPFPDMIYRQSPTQMHVTKQPEQMATAMAVKADALKRIGLPLPNLDQLVADLSEFTFTQGLNYDPDILQDRLRMGVEIAKADWNEAPHETEDEILAYYRESWGVLWDLAQWHMSMNFWLMYVLPWISVVKENQTVLDYGCGMGTLARYLMDVKKCAVAGIDVDGKPIQFAKWLSAKYPDKPSPAYVCVSGKFADAVEAVTRVKDMDIITAIEFMGHVQNPQDYLMLFHDALKPEGFLVCTQDFGGQKDHPMHLHTAELVQEFFKWAQEIGFQPLSPQVFKKVK